MNVVLAVVSVIFAVCALFVVLCNAGCVLASMRNRRLGVDRHHSTVPFVPQILLLLSAMVSPIVPRPLLWAIGLSDVGLWELACVPLFLLRQRLRRRRAG